MRYSIEGFSQERAVELGLNVEDLAILRWFVDYWPSKGMVKMTQDSKEYGFVKYSGFAEQMPIISCNKRTIARKFQRLVDSGVLENATIRTGGTYSVYRFGPNYETLVEKCATGDKNVQRVVEDCATGVVEKCATGLSRNVQPNTSTFNNTNSFNSTNTFNTKEGNSQDSTGSDFEIFRKVYNESCPRLQACQVMTGKRKTAISNFLKEFSMMDWAKVCKTANACPFLTGENDRGWMANIDFLLRTDKAAKILEGGYRDNASAGSGNPFMDIVREEEEKREQRGNSEDPDSFESVLP